MSDLFCTQNYNNYFTMDPDTKGVNLFHVTRVGGGIISLTKTVTVTLTVVFHHKKVI